MLITHGPRDPSSANFVGDINVAVGGIPILNQNTTGTSSNVTGIVAPANGGTGANAANLTSNKILASPTSGTGVPTFRTLVPGDVPQVNTSSLLGQVSIAQGGTGATTSATARTNLGLDFYSMGGCFIGIPPVSFTIFLFCADNTFVLPTNLTGSFFKCETNPSSTVAFNLYKNGGLAGTISISNTGVATFSTSQQNIVPGDLIKITTPSNVFSISNLAWTLKGNY